jgi:hypothetical protein
MTQHVIYQELPDDFFQANIPDNIAEYAMFHVNCCITQQTPRDPRANLFEYIEQIRARNTSEVRESALAGNPNDCLELGLRYASLVMFLFI